MFICGLCEGQVSPLGKVRDCRGGPFDLVPRLMGVQQGGARYKTGKGGPCEGTELREKPEEVGLGLGEAGERNK